MAIQNGSVASADEVMTAYGKILAKSAYVIWNQDFDGYNSLLGTPSWSTTYGLYYAGNNTSLNNQIKNFFGSSNTKTSAENNNFFLADTNNLPTSAYINRGAGGSPLITGDMHDTFSSATLDTNKWTTTLTNTNGSGTTTTTYTQYSGFQLDSFIHYTNGTGTTTVKAELDGLDVEDLRFGVFNMRVSGNPYNATPQVNVRHSGGTTTTVWTEASSNNDGDLKSDVNIYYDPSANEITVTALRENGGNNQLKTTTTSTSSWTGTGWRLEFVATKSNVNSSFNTQATLDVGNCAYVGANTFSSSATFDAITSGDTITHIFIEEDENYSAPTGSTVTWYASADGGSNYEQLTTGAIHYFTNTGTSLKIRGTISGDGTSTAMTAMPTLPKFIAYYNLY